LLNVIPLSMTGTAGSSTKISRLHDVGTSSCLKASAGPAQNRTQSATQNLAPTPDRAPPAPKGRSRFTHFVVWKVLAAARVVNIGASKITRPINLLGLSTDFKFM